MLSLPDSPTDKIRLADWLEIYALLSPDGNSSRGDLESALRTSGLFARDESEAIEIKALDVFSELEDRTKAAKDAYPFKIEGSLLRKLDWRTHPAYVFCLCLSYFGCREKKGSKAFPRRWFEHLSRDAAQHYLGGKALRFGSPRLKTELPVRFNEAINYICKKLNEGAGYKAGGLSDRKDDALDIIAWRHFPDELPGKLILFGNCASEKNWEGSKKTELTPEPFCSDWMIDPPKCKIIKSLFIPHRVEYKRFLSHLKRAGIIFDRCRISYCTYFSQQIKKDCIFDYSVLADWSNKQLQQARI